MTMKNAALLALVGTVLMTALLFWTFISNVAFGSLTLAIFFFVFYKAQS
jgi:hypothetical protein